MKSKVQGVQVVGVGQAASFDLPERVEVALSEIAGAAKEGLLALSVGVGLSVLGELMEEELEEVVGPKGKHDPERTAYRHGREHGQVTLGGRRLPVERPRARRADGSGELELESYRYFARSDPLTQVVLERMLAGVSARRYRRTQEPVGEEVEAKARSTSKSAVSRRFVERTRSAFEELMGRRLDDVKLAALLLDGIALAGETHVVALGVTRDGRKLALGLWEGSTENGVVATALLADLVERGLDVSEGVLVVIDGAKALRNAVRDVLGVRTPVQRCRRHKEENVLGHLPERERPLVKRKLRAAFAERDCAQALAALKALARELERTRPSAAASLREGLEETLTLRRLGVSGALERTLATTNPIESMIEIVRRTQRNVKRWRDGDMRQRWTAAGMLEAERQFRRVIGYRELPLLVAAVRAEVGGDEGAATAAA